MNLMPIAIKYRWFSQIIILGMLIALPAISMADTPDSTRRFAVLVGANDGGPERVKLRYAGTDAKAMAEVLVTLGGVQNDDHLVVYEPTVDELVGVLHEVHDKIGMAQENGRRTEFLFYYSGHSNEDGLLLSHEVMPYAELREQLNAVPSDVRVIILDSCASGTLTRMKGGQRVPAFLADQSSDVRGHAILTSSSGTEAAQESDAIEASFFTHYLIAGLRGAADSAGDRRVSLNEAYRFAYDETLARTQRTFGGTQHPEYDIQLTGRGDLVLTELDQASSQLNFDADADGRLLIRDATGRLVAEVYKRQGNPMALGFPAGSYDIQLLADEAVYQTQVTLRRGRVVTLTKSDFATVEREFTVARGDSTNESTPENSPVVGEDKTVAFGFDLFPFVGTSSIAADYRRKVSFNLVGGLSGGVDYFELGAGFNVARGSVNGVQIAGGANIVEGEQNGVQIGNINIVSRGSNGAQLGLVNIVGESFYGSQTGLVNIIGDAFSGANIGLLNIVGQSFYGAQIGQVNIVADEFDGMQLGLANAVGDSVSGAQIGLLNIVDGEVNGFQLGLLNIAKSADVGIGLLNIYTNGFFNVEAFGADDGTMLAGIRHGSGAVYNTYFVGTRFFDGKPGLATGLGIGWRTELSAAWELSIDAMATQLMNFDEGWEDINFLYKLRPMVSWSLHNKLAVFGGPTATLQMLDRDRNEVVAPVDYWELTSDNAPTRLLLWPGFTAGLRFF